jgi:hypothetical protein
MLLSPNAKNNIAQCDRVTATNLRGNVSLWHGPLNPL